MSPAAEVALRVAEEIDPDGAWNGWKLGCLERAIFNARQEGREEMEATLRPMLESAAGYANVSAGLAEHAARRAWQAMLVAFGLLVYTLLRVVW